MRYFHSLPYSTIPGPYENAALLPLSGDVDATTPRPEEIALSICAPADAPVAGAPVIVYVHGGRYEHGTHEDPRAEGTATARAGVVHVQIDYRVGLPGFAKFDEDEYFFYRGIDDVQLGLEWVQAHIEAFGGDPTNVTLIGQSAGATTALWLARRDHYRGGFRRVLAMSPCYPRAGYEHRKATLRGYLGAPLTRESLARQPEAKIAKAYAKFRKKLFHDMALGPYPLAPAELADIPIVMSSTREEFYMEAMSQKTDATPFGRAIAWWMAPKFGMRRENFATWLDLSGAGTRPLGKLIGDSCNRRWVEQVAREATGQTWMLELVRSELDSIHSKDIRYFFGNAGTGAMHRWLLDFATTGNANLPEYGDEHAVVRINLDTDERTVVHGALDYLVAAFSD